MFKIRNDEPDYAFIPDAKAPEKNQWQKEINTVDEQNPLTGKSLNINGDCSIGENKNRYKQHGFHFTADNCIGCHACEAACSEKNDLPAHISFRSVGYVEGGSYPAYKRLNISMACNHCDDPVCLKGCPTRAYTKFAEYGAVLQDPDICFGCGYCTWVCPYNAPQLDPIKGQVSKCNMCVDRLEVGLKPACAAACLGGALDFGIIETLPGNREQAKVSIPGFPTPEITNPNVRFQQVKNLPSEMTRTDSMPLRYQRDEQGNGDYKVKAALHQKTRQWSLPKLRSREDPLVIFTLVSQAVVGAFLMLFLGPILGFEALPVSDYPLMTNVFLFSLLGLQSVALGLSTMHLGKPHRFYRAFNNLKYSPVSREVASLAVFFTFFGAYVLLNSGLFNWLPAQLVNTAQLACGVGAAIAGPVFLYAMHKIYRIEARPYWNHWQVLTSFFGSALSLGGISLGLFYSFALIIHGQSISTFMGTMALIVLGGLLLEGAGLIAHARYLTGFGGEANAAHMEQTTTFGYTYLSRNLGLVLSILLIGLGAMTNLEGFSGLFAWAVAAIMILASAITGRALFYVLVIPTTMPGAFFWRNQGFQQHARESGLAQMPQTGVLPETDYHHLQLERALSDIKQDAAKIKKIGLRAIFKNRLKATFSRTGEA